MIIIIKPLGLEEMPHHWTLIDDTGMHILDPCVLVEESRDRQAAIIEAMVAAYNDKLLENNNDK